MGAQRTFEYLKHMFLEENKNIIMKVSPLNWIPSKMITPHVIAPQCHVTTLNIGVNNG